MPRPRLWEFGELSDSLDGPHPVVGSVLVHDKRFPGFGGWSLGRLGERLFIRHTIGL